MSEERIEVKILGRVLGTASGWDGDPGEVIWFYDFEPKEGINLQKGELQFNFDTGNFGLPDEEGELIAPLDMVSFLSGVSR